MNSKVYSFYQPIETDPFSIDSKKLINTWQMSWKRFNWDPITLSSLDAHKHPEIKNAELDNFDTGLYNPCINDKPYLKLCYERWFAYAHVAIENNGMFWADYDVININFSKEKAEKLNKDIVYFSTAHSSGYMSKESAKILIKNIIQAKSSNEKYFWEHPSLKKKYISDMTIFKACFEHKCPGPTYVNSNPGEMENWEESPLLHFHGGTYDFMREYLSEISGSDKETERKRLDSLHRSFLVDEYIKHRFSKNK